MKRTPALAVCAVLACIALIARGAPLRNYPQRLVQPDESFVRCFASSAEPEYRSEKILNDELKITVNLHRGCAFLVISPL